MDKKEAASLKKTGFSLKSSNVNSSSAMNGCCKPLHVEIMAGGCRSRAAAGNCSSSGFMSKARPSKSRSHYSIRVLLYPHPYRLSAPCSVMVPEPLGMGCEIDALFVAEQSANTDYSACSTRT